MSALRALRSSGHVAAALGLAAFAVAADGAGSDDEAGAAGDPFTHAEHAALEEPPICADCHDARAGRVPALRESACIECHDEVPAWIRRPSTPLLDEVRFTHEPHEGTACRECHAPAAGPSGVAPQDPLAPEHVLTATSARCLSCHERGPAAAPREQACVRCHGREERRVAPESHGASWIRTHGAGARPFFADHGESCTLCHRESACVACHRVERPRDHDALWRTRLHGTAAAWDRQRCKTCHEPGQCIACHRIEEPRNHRGAWTATHGLVARAKQDASCATCHRQSFCNTCHRGTP